MQVKRQDFDQRWEGQIRGMHRCNEADQLNAAPS